MIDHLKVSYENLESSSYLTVAFTQESGLIQYQLEMLTSNEISHLLRASKRMLNGDTIAYYNISSRIPLSKVLERRKLKREEFLHIIEGAILAVKDAGEYQLAMSGFIMDPDYIYLDPSDCNPFFLYLPIMSSGDNGIRQLLLGLIMQGKIELSNDNFIQVLLEAINCQPFSVERLEACISGFKSDCGKRPVTDTSQKSLKRASADTPPLYVQGRPDVPQSETPYGQGEQRDAYTSPDMKPLPPARRKDSNKKQAGTTGKKEKKEQAEANNAAACDDTEFDAVKAKKKFILPQAVIMVAVAALISFGGFCDDTGSLLVNNVLAAFIVIGVAEIILYREAYVNSQKKRNKATEKKGVNSRKNGMGADDRPKPHTMEKSRPLPKKNADIPVVERPKLPGAESPKPLVTERPNSWIKDRRESIQTSPDTWGSHPDDMDLTDETVVWDSKEAASCLEHYENGMMTRIPLDRDSVLVGRLKGQVDFAVANPKVGKIHAEFIIRDGMFFVKDLNSKNGTYINNSGQRINSNIPYPLNDNDRIILADSEFVLRCGVR